MATKPDKEKRKRMSVYNDSVTVIIHNADIYTEQCGDRWTAFELASTAAGKKGRDVYSRFKSNLVRGKYKAKKIFGTMFIDIDDPLTDTNCSVSLKFIVGRTK